MKIYEIITEQNKITLSTDPSYYGADGVGNYRALGPIINVATNKLVGFEPDSKMKQPESKEKVEKIVAKLKQGTKLPPLLVRKYKNGYQVLDGHHRFWAYKLLKINSVPVQIVPADDIQESSEQDFLWHGAREKYNVIKANQAVDSGNAAGSNQNAIYGTKDKDVAIKMALPTADSDHGMFLDDPAKQVVIYKGDIRKGQNVYLYKLPRYDQNHEDMWIAGGNAAEFYTNPKIKSLKPIDVEILPVNNYLHMVRHATSSDIKRAKEFKQA